MRGEHGPGAGYSCIAGGYSGYGAARGHGLEYDASDRGGYGAGRVGGYVFRCISGYDASVDYSVGAGVDGYGRGAGYGADCSLGLGYGSGADYGTSAGYRVLLAATSTTVLATSSVSATVPMLATMQVYANVMPLTCHY